MRALDGAGRGVTAPRQLAAAPLVGRDSERDRLRAAVARVAGGAPGVVFLSGLPGVGKTRLAQEALACAGEARFATFSGRAHDLASDFAYAPLIEAFGASLRGSDARRRDDLVGDLPQLGLVFSGLGLRPPEPLGDPALERTRLMDGFTRLIERMARQRPLALLIDDVHAAEAATTGLLRYLAATVTDQPILLVLTARRDEPGHDRVAVLSTGLAESTWWVEHVAVQPLVDADATALLDSLLGERVDDRLARLVLERCAGRPLFLRAVAHTLAESGRVVERDGALHLSGGGIPLPEGVRAQLRSRLVPVTPDEETLLRLLGVAGRDLEHDLLVRAAGLPRQHALDALDRLHQRGLIVASPAFAGYDLAHGLLRDALLAELSPVAIEQAHANLVQAITAVRPDDPRIPQHVLGAGPLFEPDQALDHLMRGGEHARMLGATEDAERYLAAAVAIARAGRRAEVLADLLSELGRARQWLGVPDQARASWGEAVAEYSARGDAVGVARTQRELAMLAWSQADLDAAWMHLAAADRALEGLAESPEHAELLYARMITAARVGDVEMVAATATRLRALAGQLDSPALSARTYFADAMVDCAATDYVAMVDNTQRGLSAALASGDPVLVTRGYDQLSVAAATQGELATLRQHSAASLQVARRLGAPYLEGWPRLRLAITDLLAGDWDAALRGTSEIMAIARRYAELRGMVSAGAAHAFVLAHRGRLDDARHHLDVVLDAAAPKLEADQNIFSMVALAGATLALAQGDPQQALRWTKHLEDLSASWLGLISVAVLGEARARSGDAGGARGLATRIRAVRSCTTVLPGALADWLEGLIDASTGHQERGATRLAGAARGFDRLGLPFHAARARLARGGCLAESQPVVSVENARSALEAFERLGAPIQAQEARALLRLLGEVPSRGRRRSQTVGRLSARELEVGRLVASSLSNADVAAQLFISPRTVTTHLDRIYARLGLSSRVALTRYLADSGLLGEDDESTTVNLPVPNT